ncbi:MAG: pyridoxamine 5'-phosphate oxidase family protein [Nitrosopumilus sp.]|nr:pyridoxamine 5'-phosphate oxidase family protein [Nitrosopumilus sp.]NNL57921.1 pyridoxamine 5'-phosphate oxidase family protein [Nitrosopumilus sp.]
MKLLGRLEIKSYEKIKEFLSKEHIGRIASIDGNGYPQIIPMNFAFLNDAVYMHSYIRGEKLDNIIRNQKVGFEVDRELEFLPSYFSHPTDASQADTLYISVVIKGNASIVDDDLEKSLGLNALMEKYQPEGHYEPLTKDDLVLDEVAVIKIVPDSIKGKYKIGQHMSADSRTILAKKILERNSTTSKKTLEIMGFEVTDNGLKMIDEPVW